MGRVGYFVAGVARRQAVAARSNLGVLLAGCAALVAALAIPERAAQAADPAVSFMERVSRDLIVAARSRSPVLLSSALNRYGATSAIALSSLGDYRAKLTPSDQPAFVSGTVNFIARYAASEAPKFPVSHVIFKPESRAARYGLMVDSTVHLSDGSTYDVSWMLVKAGSTYRVRDAQLVTFGQWMTPFLRDLFEKYIAENGGNVRALVMALNR